MPQCCRDYNQPLVRAFAWPRVRRISVTAVTLVTSILPAAATTKTTRAEVALSATPEDVRQACREADRAVYVAEDPA